MGASGALGAAERPAMGVAAMDTREQPPDHSPPAVAQCPVRIPQKPIRWHQRHAEVVEDDDGLCSDLEPHGDPLEQQVTDACKDGDDHQQRCEPQALAEAPGHRGVCVQRANLRVCREEEGAGRCALKPGEVKRGLSS